MSDAVTNFNEYRSRMNEKLLDGASMTLKRIFSLDNQAYKAGSLDVATKELLGLVASMVLRCDDCVKYHLENCHKEQLSKNQVMEAVGVARGVGGSSATPHKRRPYEYWEARETETK